MVDDQANVDNLEGIDAISKVIGWWKQIKVLSFARCVTPSHPISCYSISPHLTPFTLLNYTDKLLVMFCCRGFANLTFDESEVRDHDGEIISDKEDRKLSALKEREEGHLRNPSRFLCNCLYVPLCSRIPNGYHLVPMWYPFCNRYL